MSIMITKDQPIIANNKETDAAFKRFVSEIRNRTYVMAYLAVKDCVSQKDYCKRVDFNESQFSRLLSKIEEELATSPKAS